MSDNELLNELLNDTNTETETDIQEEVSEILKNEKERVKAQPKKKHNKKSSNKIVLTAVLLVILAVIAAVVLISNAPNPLEGNWYKGTWLYLEGEQTSLTALETIIGSNCVAVFHEDGTGYLDMMGGEIIDVTYNRTTVTIMGENVPYELSDEGELKLSVPDPSGERAEIVYQQQEGDIPPLSTADDLKDWEMFMN